MKIGMSRSGLLSVCAALCAWASFGDGPESITIASEDVTSLTNHLDRLNRINSPNNKGRGDVITLEPGFYDVSKCHMLCDAAGTMRFVISTSHLAIAFVTLKGSTSNPRDTVIYGDGSDRILYMFGGRLENVTVSNGCQTVGDSGGAGVDARNSLSVLSNVVVTCCTSKQKGGGAHYTDCYDCIIENCHSDAAGGGIYYSSYFYRGEIRNNTSGTSGGGASNVRLWGTSVHHNTAAEGAGGFIYAYAGGQISSNCTIYCNTAKTGGGVGSSTTIYDCTVSNNVAVLGGGIAECTAHKCRIVHNLARAKGSDNYPKGGGCYAKDAACRVYDSLVAGNACALENSAGSTGGGGEKTDFYRCEIRDNFCRVGAAMNQGSAEDCTISNDVSSLYSHGIRATSRLTRCKIYKEALTSPGAMTDCVVRDYGVSWTLPAGANVYTNGTFLNASPAEDNAKLFVNTASGTFAMTNCLIVANEVYSILAKDKDGVPVNVVNCTIADNTNTCMIGGFRSDAATPTTLYLKNTIICRNKQRGNASVDLNFYPRYGSSKETNIYIENCMIGPGWLAGQTTLGCTGLISSNDPKFMMRRDEGNPYSLRPGSDAIGKGTVEGWMASAFDIRCVDGGEYPRLRDGKVDLGCYQCWTDPVGSLFIVK